MRISTLLLFMSFAGAALITSNRTQAMGTVETVTMWKGAEHIVVNASDVASYEKDGYTTEQPSIKELQTDDKDGEKPKRTRRGNKAADE